ncbi:MAG: hypothetical protein JRG80_03700 [Deltaproteobacteria bacterium]|nr:hypothetical protein [Deltaproteobacteria bacterium]MBW2398358.1 hypothetical protein [Deltaproteobacteria bacterium]MBW2667386.1 hypothetical protein [Deltaproteobacteria bacterium]
MNRRVGRPPQAPPLWLWPIVVGFVATVFAVTLDDYLGEAVTSREANDHAHRMRIAEFALQRADHPRTLHVIALGDSSLRNALFFGHEMEQYSLANGGPELRFLRITHPRAKLNEFLALFDAILAAKPDLLVIQAWLLPDRMTEKRRLRHLSYQAGEIPSFGISRKQHREQLLHHRKTLQHQAWIVDRVIAKLGSWIGYETGLGRRFADRQRRYACYPAYRDDQLSAREGAHPASGEFAVDPTAAATIDLLVEQAAAAGIRLVFVDIPVASPIAELPGIRRKDMMQRDFFASHSGNPTFDHWIFDRTIPDADFCDWIHLARQGRSIFSSWFVERLQRVAAEAEAG